MLFLMTGCFLTGCSQKEEVIVPGDFAAIQSNPSEIELQMVYSEITVGMIGDILLHHPLYTYDNYDASFSAVKDKMTGIDFLIANQESLPGGVELVLSGYPRFNSPKHIIRDLKANGVDLLSIANNHTMDKSERGLLNAINYMNEYGMPYVGAYESIEDRNEMRVFNVKGIRIGVLCYTYGLNGLPVPSGKDYMVSLIDREQMENDIREIRKEADVTVVSIHWGNEYALQPSQYQQELADWLAAQQVDIIFGHHPHVLQPYAEIGKTKVFYSLGNFYSAQQFDSTYIGGIAEVTVAKGQYAARSFVEVRNSTFFPTAVVRDKNRRFVVIPLQENVVGLDSQWVEMHVGLPRENKK